MGTNFSIMVKMLGCVMVFAGCTALGLKFSGRLKEKRLVLMKLKDMLLLLENKMCTLGIPLTRAFEDVSRENSGEVWAGLFSNSSRIMRERGLDAGTAWRAALNEIRDTLPVDDADIELINGFGELLGRSDREMQHAVLGMIKEKVSAMELRAKETADSTGKLYRNLGALIGAAAVILLI